MVGYVLPDADAVMHSSMADAETRQIFVTDMDSEAHIRQSTQNNGKEPGTIGSRGIDERPIQPDPPRKSVGSEDAFAVDILSLEAASAEIMPLVEKVSGAIARRSNCAEGA